jgi:mRNA interferase MazF
VPLLRLPITPNERNGLRVPCQIRVDKITSVPKTKVGTRIGRLDDSDLLRLNRAVIVFLGLGASPRTGVDA